MAVEGDHRDAELDARRRCRRRSAASVSRPLAAGVVVGPHRAVAELGAAAASGVGDLGIEAGGDAEAAALLSSALVAHFSSSATHSMCGVWGNMSIGFTRFSVYPASASCAAFGASVVGLQET